MRFRPHAVLAVLLSLWVLWFGYSVIMRHLNLHSAQFDLGIMDQVLWQTVHGHVFQMTSPVFADLQSRATIHADWLLLIYTPFYSLWQDPRTILVLQVLFVATGAWPLYQLALRRFTPGVGVAFAALYLLQPVLQWSILFDVHAVVLVTPLVLWAAWAASTRRYVLLWLTMIAAMLSKEEIGLVVALIAFVLWVKKFVSGRQAIALAATGVGWVILMTAVVIPAVTPNGTHFAISYFSEYGQNVPEILLGILRHPIIFIRDLVNITSFGYLAILLGAVAWWPLRRPWWIVPAVPTLVMNLISNDPNMHAIYFQYTAAITPFLLLAALDGMAAPIRFVRQRWQIAWTMAWVLAMVWVWAPLPLMRHNVDALGIFTPNPYGAIVRRINAELPINVPVAVSNDLGPQFSRRERLWVFPNRLDRADAVVVYLGRSHDVLPQAELQQRLQELQHDPKWETVASWNNELFYLRRVNLR